MEGWIVNFIIPDNPRVRLEVIQFRNQEEQAPYEVHHEQHRDRDRDHPFDTLIHFHPLQNLGDRPIILDQPNQL
jgi:hypothetical protein